MPKVIGEELGVDPNDLEKSFALRALGGTESGGYVYFNFWSSGPAADTWQVLSPVKGDAAGTLILNRLIQAGFRAETRKRAQQQAPNWIDRGQAATVLKTIAVFEDVLQECLEGCMRPLTPKIRAKLFDGYGPISTLAAKADIAYGLNLLADQDYTDLQIIRKIRNEFAHSREVMGFEKPKIEGMVFRLQKPRTEADTAYRWYFARLTEIGYRVIDAAVLVNRRFNRKPRGQPRRTVRKTGRAAKP